MEKQRADTGKKQGSLDVQGQAVALDQDGYQHRSAEHGKHVLETQDHHLGHTQLPGVLDGAVLFMVHDVSSSLSHTVSHFLLFPQANGQKNTGDVSPEKRNKRGEIKEHCAESRSVLHFEAPFCHIVTIIEGLRAVSQVTDVIIFSP